MEKNNIWSWKEIYYTRTEFINIRAYFQLNINSYTKFLKTYIWSDLEIVQTFFILKLYTNQIVKC